MSYSFFFCSYIMIVMRRKNSESHHWQATRGIILRGKHLAFCSYSCLDKYIFDSLFFFFFFNCTLYFSLHLFLGDTSAYTLLFNQS